MAEYKENIYEAIDERKQIPQGDELDNLMSIYKVVQTDTADGYKACYHRKLSAGWNNRGAYCYGILGYTTASIEDAMHLRGFGGTIIEFKLLGGVEDYLFFNTERGYWDAGGVTSRIRNLMMKTWGGIYSLEEQLYKLTGNREIAQKYAHYDSGSFGRTGQHEIRKDGYFIRGMVCAYGNCMAIYPFVFSDMITYRIAKDVEEDSKEQIEAKLRRSDALNDTSREQQSKYIDLVPHLQVLGISMADADRMHSKLVGDKFYVPYSIKGEHNILIIDDTEHVRPKNQKLFPPEVKLNQTPTISAFGDVSFKMNGMNWKGNVLGKDSSGTQITDGTPVFSLTGRQGEWYEWQYLPFMYQNPDWVRQNLLRSMNEEFTPGMSIDDFTNSSDNAIGYVCAHGYSVDGILAHGFSREFANANDFRQNGGQLTYGDGQYGSITLDNAANNLSRKTDSKADGLKYGNVILKCVINGGWKNFLIFDGRLAKQVYGDRWRVLDQIDTIIKDENSREELKNYAKKYLSYELYDPRNDGLGRTNHIIFNMFQTADGVRKWTNFFRRNGVRGCIYHGHGDRYCFVCYDFTEVVPIAVSYDYGQTFTTGPNTWTDAAGTHSTKGINWEETSKRLEYNGDTAQKLSHLYKSVATFPKRVTCGGKVFGCVSVEKDGKKFNCVNMSTLEEIFPVDFDSPVIISFDGKIKFRYNGYQFEGLIYNPECDSPSIKTPYGVFSMNDIDSVIYYYYQGHINDVQQQDNGNYEEQDADTQQQEIAESFFKLLDKLETL